MQMLFVNYFFNDEVIKALCWTFLHSLWQGLLLAILAGGVVIFTRKTSPAVRYNMLVTLFALFLAGAVFTFSREVRSVGAPSTHVTVTSPGSVTEGTVGIMTAATKDPQFIEQFVNYFNTHAALVVAIWFIVFLARTVKMLSGLVYIQKVRYHGTHEPPAEWRNELSALSRRLQLKRVVTLLESEIVRVPLTVGTMKPVILLPLGLLTNLPQDQLEAILLHELAHIRRGDYWVNLMQSFVETLFFFNPAALWVSSLIREERESCCDEIAIGETKSKRNFISALIAFQEYNYNTESLKYATAFPGRKEHLLDRAKRIVNNRNKSLNGMEKFSILCSLALLCTLMLVFPGPQKSSAVPAVTAAKDTLAQKTGSSLAIQQQVLLQFPKDTIKPDTTMKHGKTGTQRVLGGGQEKRDSSGKNEGDILIDKIIADLIEAKVIKDRTDLSFKLNRKELIVNGAKVPADLQKKLSDKYITSSSMNVMYAWWE